MCLLYRRSTIMADLYKNFRSQSDIIATKNANREARQLILEKAQKRFEIDEAKREKARHQGEGTWMLDSVSHRISKEEQALSKAKKKSKKKKKKKKKKKSHSSSSSDSESGEEEQEDKWVESTPAKEANQAATVKGPQLQRESWMEAPLDLIPTTSRQEIRDAINKDKEEARRAAEKAQEPGQHGLELNPYWKDGGSGLPEDRKKAESKATSSQVSTATSAPLGDGGYSWLQKAYSRCVQQAEDEGRSLEEVAAERWGSLKKLQKMLSEAKQKSRSVQGGGTPGDNLMNRHHDRARNNSRDRQRERGSSRDRMQRKRSSSRERRRERSSSRERHRRRSRSIEKRRDQTSSRDRQRERSKSMERRHDKHDRNDRRTSPQRSRFKRPGSDDESHERNGSSRSSFRRPADDGDDSPKTSISFMKPSDRHDRSDTRQGASSRHSVRPGEGRGEDSRRESRRSRSPDRSVSRWRKKIEAEPQKEPKQSREEHKPKEIKNKERTSRERISRPSPPSASGSNSDSTNNSDSNSEDERHQSDKEEMEDTPRAPTAKILSEEELNDLAAKILRAEIMGEDDLAADLKAKLEEARQLREASRSNGGLPGKNAPDFSCRRQGGGSRGGRERKKDEDNVVVLTRTSKGGMVRPVQGGGADQWGSRPGKKRKKAATTHDISGERTIYFDDDNKFDLKSLVEQEKAGTAEDQNAMFARLAGRAGDRDLDVDDMFVSKAARKQNEEGAANRDRSVAIFEHRKISAAMEKCSRCFDKVPKHLIIAIGAKSYLCLPPHRSLTEGHCLIVPMQHVSSCVAMDEDVWREMQLFRKSLVQMFLAQDEDLVVMETVMHLKHFPHTAIECIPLEKETGDLAPIYFKKAIQEAGPEWADNKKLHSLREKDVRHVIPKGFPYFSVDFGLQGGYATVIEDEQTFSSFFGREIVGGMIDAEPSLWRKPHKQSFEDQRQKVLKFEAMWRPHDWTQNLDAGD